MSIKSVIARAAAAVHRQWGSHQKVDTYLKALCEEMNRLGQTFIQRPPVADPAGTTGVLLGGDFVDLLVDQRMVVEVRTLERLLPIHLNQVRAYLNAGQWPGALIINFQERDFSDAIFCLDRFGFVEQGIFYEGDESLATHGQHGQDRQNEQAQAQAGKELALHAGLLARPTLGAELFDFGFNKSLLPGFA